MPNLSYSRTGYSFYRSTAAQLTAAYVAFPVTRDATNSARSTEFPNSCNIQSVEFQLTSISAASLGMTVYLARDSAGTVPLTPATTSGATQDITYVGGTTTTGGAVFVVDADFNYDSQVSNITEGTLYVVAKLNTALRTATADIRVNWRA